MTHYMVKSQTVDGVEYLSGFGWTGDVRHALVMSHGDALIIAEREQAKRPVYQDPDTGRFRLAPTKWHGPYLYTVADHDADERERAALDELYGDETPGPGYRYRDYPGQGEG